MSININTRSVRFFYQSTNGDDFSIDPNNFSPQLLANVMENIKFRARVDVQWFALSESWTFTGGNLLQVNDINLLDEGFSIGDRIALENSAAPGIALYDILDIIGGSSALLNPVLGAIPNGVYTDQLAIRGLTPQTGLVWSFGLIENNEVFNTFSKLDNSLLQYYFEEVGEVTNNLPPQQPVRDTSFSDGVFNNPIIGSKTGVQRARFVEYLPDQFTAPYNQLNSVQSFEIEHEFIGFPYFREGEDGNLENIQPPADLFADGKSLKYAYELDFRNVYTNPNTQKVKTFDGDLGSFGYYNEVFNGFQQAYTLDSVVITNLNTFLPIPSIQTNAPCRVTAVISNVNGTDFTVDQPICVAYHSRTPNSDIYSEQQEQYRDIWLYDAVRTVPAQPGVSGNYIQLFSIAVLNSTQIQIDFEVNLDAAAQARLSQEEPEGYVLGLTIINKNKDDVNTSTKQTLLLQAADYIVESDIPGLITGLNMQVFPHQIDLGDTGFNNYSGWVEDGFLTEMSFDAELDLNAVIESVTAVYGAYNVSTQDYFAINTVPVPIDNQVIGSNGQQVITLNSTRGFNLVDGDQFNFLNVITESFDVPNNKQPYKVQVGFKANWQQWLQLLDVPSVFTDQTQPFNGQNQLSSRYSNSNGYVVAVWYDIVVSQDGLNTTYRHISGDFDIRIYEDDNGNRYSAVINTFRADGITPTNGIVLASEDTIIEVRYTPIGHATTAADVYGINRIEEQLQGGFNIDECSSIRDTPLTSRMIPTEGNSFAEVFDDAGDIVVRTRTNTPLINANAQYKLSSKLGSNEPAALGAFDNGFDDGFE